MFATIIISAKAAKQLKGSYPWVYVRDVLSRRFPTAGIVGVLDKRGEFLGQAFYSPRSKIALRLITKSKEKINGDFWAERVKTALTRRKEYVAQDCVAQDCVAQDFSPANTGRSKDLRYASNAFRVAYAESDGMPSIIIDKYNDIVSFQITSAGAETVKNDIIAAIKEVLRPAAIIEKNDIAVRRLEGLPLVERIIFGDKTTTVIMEGDQRFEVDVLHGQKTGAYLDYRGFRLKARDLSFPRKPVIPAVVSGNPVNSRDPRVRGDDKLTALDLFCYQGWMACHLAKDFTKVIAVDASQDAIDAAKRNAELNGIPLCHPQNPPSPCGRELEGGVTPHPSPLPQGERGCIEFISADAFEFLEGLSNKGDSPPQKRGLSPSEKQKVACPLFDLIHLDPPPFAVGRENLPAALKGYERLLSAAIKLLKEGGILFVSSCSHHISENVLERIVQEAAKVSGSLPAGRQGKFQVIYRGIQDSDHPVMKNFPESLYLKAIAVRI